MGRFVVLLRGVNVGKGNKVPMAEFRATLEGLGHGSVRTLLNSGNAVFSSASRNTAKLATATLLRLTERYCVVLQTLRSSPSMSRTVRPNIDSSRETLRCRGVIASTTNITARKATKALKKAQRKPVANSGQSLNCRAAPCL